MTKGSGFSVSEPGSPEWERVAELLEQDARDWPEGHPCRACGRLHREHPTAECARWW